MVIPALTCGALKRNWPKFSDLRRRVQDASGEDISDALPELMGAQVALIHAALRRNYPDLTLEQLEDDLEMSQVGALFARLVEYSRLDKGDASAGEAKSPQS